MRNKLYFFLIFLFMLPIAVAWTPPSDINLRNFYQIFNGTNVNVTNFYQNGNAVLDNSSNISTANFSSFSNSSNNWDDLDVPEDITQVGTLNNLTVTGNASASWFNGFVNWSNIQNAIITAADDIYLYFSGSTITLNETVLNNTIVTEGSNNFIQLNGSNTPMTGNLNIGNNNISNISNIKSNLSILGGVNITSGIGSFGGFDANLVLHQNALTSWATVMYDTRNISRWFGYYIDSTIDDGAFGIYSYLDVVNPLLEFRVNDDIRIQPTTGYNTRFLTGDVFVDNNLTVVDEIKTSRLRLIDGGNESYIKVNDDEWIGLNDSIVYGNNEPNLALGVITNLFYAQENKTLLWTQFGQNNSYGGWGHSFGLVPNDLGINNFSMGGKVNMTALSNYILLCDTFGVGCDFNADTLGRARGLIPGGPLLWTMGDLEVWGQANIIEGAAIRTNLDVFLNNSDLDIVGGRVHLREEVTVEIGFDVGDEVQTLHETFEDGELDPFVQETTGGGASEWSVVSIPACNNDFCAEASGAGGDPLRTMVANFSTVDMDNCNLTFLLTTVGLDSGDVFNVSVNNNSGSGDVLLFNITDGTDVTAITINISSITSEINNNSANSLRFTLQAGNNEDAVVDDVFLHCNANASTLANVSRFNSEICLGEGILLANGRCIYDIFWNDTSKILELPGNTSFEDVTEITLNVTTSITLGAETITEWSNVSTFDTNVLLTDGSRGLTANWNAGPWNITASWFNGAFNWIVGGTGYLSFNGTQLDFNETKLNSTFQKNITPDSCGGGDFVNAIFDNGTLTCDTPAGGGTITGVFTNSSDNYLAGNTNSGIADLSFNETRLAIYTDARYSDLGNFTNNPGYMTAIVNDTSPVLGGDLNASGNNITDVNNITFSGNITHHYITDNSTTIEIHGNTASIYVW